MNKLCICRVMKTQIHCSVDTLKSYGLLLWCLFVILELDSPIYFNFMDNFPFCVPQKKENNTDYERHVGDQMMSEFSFLVKHSRNIYTSLICYVWLLNEWYLVCVHWNLRTNFSVAQDMAMHLDSELTGIYWLHRTYMLNIITSSSHSNGLTFIF